LLAALAFLALILAHRSDERSPTLSLRGRLSRQHSVDTVQEATVDSIWANALRFRSSVRWLVVQANLPRRAGDEIADDTAHDSTDDRTCKQHPDQPWVNRREQHLHLDGLGVLEGEDDEASEND
jgi:hypothetical protein